MGEKMNKKSFTHNGQTFYYFTKDIELTEARGKEMAAAFVVLCDDNDNQIDFFRIYDERIKVLYAMPNDVSRWYLEYLSEK